MVHSRPRSDRVINRLMLGDVEVLDEEKEEDQAGELEEVALKEGRKDLEEGLDTEKGVIRR